MAVSLNRCAAGAQGARGGRRGLRQRQWSHACSATGEGTLCAGSLHGALAPIRVRESCTAQ
eukprot:11183907-Lingulodinium_polyedra.AAC.1